MLLRIDPCGRVTGRYTEALDLAALGEVSLRRAGHVEPDARGRWRADLSPVGGPVLGPFGLRSEALAAEAAWLDGPWLLAASGVRSG